jgi:hypothetical protein
MGKSVVFAGVIVFLLLVFLSVKYCPQQYVIHDLVYDDYWMDTEWFYGYQHAEHFTRIGAEWTLRRYRHSGEAEYCNYDLNPDGAISWRTDWPVVVERLR